MKTQMIKYFLKEGMRDCVLSLRLIREVGKNISLKKWKKMLMVLCFRKI